jgi:hypothetical protein
VFEPFRQGPDAPTHSPGVGVGLSLVARFAELHGGRAWVEERIGGGAAFRVLLSSEPRPATESVRLPEDPEGSEPEGEPEGEPAGPDGSPDEPGQTPEEPA